MSLALVDTCQLTLARHETFHIRDGWLTKGLDALADEPVALSVNGAHNHLGVGKNMLTAIRYWVQAAGLALPAGKRVGGRQPLRITKVGAIVAEFDHFFEDMASLWVAHIELASNQTLATLFYWAFNELETPAFRETDLCEGFKKHAESLGATDLNDRSIKKDASVVKSDGLVLALAAELSIRRHLENPASHNRRWKASIPGRSEHI
jgi:hypothetical protein